MKKIILTSLLLPTLFSMTVFGAELKEMPTSKAAGYYYTDDNMLLLLGNGTAYSNGNDAEGLYGPMEYSALSYDDNIIIIESETNTPGYLSLQKDKGATENGGLYYALYSNYLGTTSDITFDEGKQIKVGDYIFDNDYEVIVREPLSNFFGISVNADNTAVKMEGSGFSSPEEAVAAYIEGLQNSDIDQMISAHAVETYAENYSLVKTIERIKSYNITLGYIPNISDFSTTLNVEYRRSSITDAIRYQYLILTNSSTLTGEHIGVPIPLNESYESAEDLQNSLFVTDDTSYIENISFNGIFIDPNTLNLPYSTEVNQKHRQKQADAINADKIESVACILSSNGCDYLLCMDVVQYGEKWYVLNGGGNLASILGLHSMSGGLALLEDEPDIRKALGEYYK